MKDLKQYDTFKQWMADHYTDDDFLNIYHSGCVNGVSGLIYYDETTELFNAFEDEMFDILAEYKNMTGEMPSFLPDAILEGPKRFKNAVVWFVAEWYADEEVQRIQTRDEEEV